MNEIRGRIRNLKPHPRYISPNFPAKHGNLGLREAAMFDLVCYKPCSCQASLNQLGDKLFTISETTGHPAMQAKIQASDDAQDEADRSGDKIR